MRTIVAEGNATPHSARRGFEAARRTAVVDVLYPIARARIGQADRMTQIDAQFPQLYQHGAAFFNECEFFEAHETWEELWTEYRGPARRFYQGLIQAAVALHHFGNGNLGGAKKVYATSRNYLDDYRPTYEGLDLESFLAQYERCFAALLECQDAKPTIEIDPELIPEIHLDPELAARN